MKKLILATVIILFSFYKIQAQVKNFTISGTVKDTTSGEVLIGALVFVKEPEPIGINTNEYGFYSISLKPGKYKVIYSFTGYIDDTVLVDLKNDFRIDKSLKPFVYTTEEISVTDDYDADKLGKPISGVEKFDLKEIKRIPVLFGEKDILKTIQLLPGIKGSSEGSSGISVRGGNYDQNLIILDESPVYNVSHMLGFFSTFNSDAINDVTVYKGTQPSYYGGRLSSVIDIKLKEGNSKDYNLSGGLGLISSNIKFEGPIVREKGSFIISGRRSYADLFLKLSSDEEMRNRELYFYDINLKSNYQVSDKDRIYLSGYLGRDKMGFGSDFIADWGNSTGTFRLNHILSNKLFSNTSLIFSNYSYNISTKDNDNNYNIKSSITDYSIKEELQLFPNNSHSLRFGFNVMYHDVTPGLVDMVYNTFSAVQDAQERKSIESSIWFNDEWAATKKLNISAGLRITTFSVLGKGNFYNLDESNNIVDTVTYNGGVVKTYINPEPRLSLSYLLGSKSSIKAAYTRNIQHFHLLSNSSSSNPTDKWVSSTNNIKPEIGDQLSLGYFYNNSNYEYSIEGYYKKIQNVIDYKDNANVTNTDAIESQLLYGDGRSYGLEFLLKKKVGKLTGWISYMLSRTEQKINTINKNEWYASKQDATHDISVVGIYNLNNKFTLSATWVYHTGNAVTFPSGKYTINNKVVFYYTERNSYRMPAYHRLDVGGTVKLGSGNRFSSELAFGCYNLYGNKNAYTIDFRESTTDPDKTVAVKTYLFQWVPYITWNVNFK